MGAAEAREIATAGLTQYERLSPTRRRFVDEYLLDLNGWQAAIRAGFAGVSAYDLLHHKGVIAAIRERRALLDGERALSGARYVVNKLWDIESADPRELCAVWKIPCRFCWGVNGQYQFTKTEMRRRSQAHELGRKNKPIESLYPCGRAEQAAWFAGNADLPLDPQGGDDYTTKREPNPSCTECGGDGITIQHIADTRHLSNGARALFRGAKLTKDGTIEIMMADQAVAREQLARHYGVAVERKRLLVRKLNPDELSDEELVQSLAELEERIKAQEEDTVEAEFEVLDEPVSATMPPPSKKPRRQPKTKYVKPVPGKRTQTRRWGRKPITRPT